MITNPEELLNKEPGGKETVEGDKLPTTVHNTPHHTTHREQELSDASELLAKTTQASAELLAETTQISAELLAKTTQTSAELLSRSSEITAKWMKWLTVALIAVGIIQIALAVIALLVSMR